MIYLRNAPMKWVTLSCVTRFHYWAHSPPKSLQLWLKNPNHWRDLNPGPSDPTLSHGDWLCCQKYVSCIIRLIIIQMSGISCLLVPLMNLVVLQLWWHVIKYQSTMHHHVELCLFFSASDRPDCPARCFLDLWWLLYQIPVPASSGQW